MQQTKRNIRRGLGSGRGDYRYLVQPRGDGTAWYVAAEVPRTLRKAIQKKRLLRSLRTADINVARIARWNALDSLKREIASARTASNTSLGPLLPEALEFRDRLLKANHKERDDLLYEIVDRAEQIQREDRSDWEPQSPEDQDEVPSKKASDFAKLATGKATPLSTYIERWLAAARYSERTSADARTILKEFDTWCRAGSHSGFIEDVNDKVASDFRDQALVQKQVHPVTANKKLTLLRRYWDWLDRSFGIRPNPWARKSLPKPKAHRATSDGADAPERQFTDNEVATLLKGDADRDLADFMRIAALSGMRLEEIGQLRVRDCKGGSFTITRGKTAAAIRTIPIHSQLKRIVERRTRARTESAYLFSNLSDTGWDGNRTMALSKRFNYFRKRRGVDDTRPGSRRSKVNFHSFRRWFATKAEEAGQRENVVAAVMGHAKNVGLTFGHYSKAELTELKRQCVEAVRLPTR